MWLRLYYQGAAPTEDSVGAAFWYWVINWNQG